MSNREKRRYELEWGRLMQGLCGPLEFRKGQEGIGDSGIAHNSAWRRAGPVAYEGKSGVETPVLQL